MTNWRQEAAAVGTVQTPDGLPVSGAFVSMGDLDSGDDTDLTGPAGRFAIDAMPSYTTLRAVARLGGTVWHGEIPADGAPFDWTITLHPSSSARDRVVLVDVKDPYGEPVPRAQVVRVSGKAQVPFREHCYDGVKVTGGRFPVHAARWEDGEVPVFLIRDARDREGRSLPLGPVLVAVDPTGPASMEVRLPFGSTVEGRVKLSDGSAAWQPCAVSFQGPLPEGFDMSRMDRPPPMCRWTDGLVGFGFASGLEGEGVLRVDGKAGVLPGSDPVVVAAGEHEVVIRFNPVEGD